MSHRIPTVRPSRGNQRAGNVLVLSAFMLVILLCMVAFAVDVGYVLVERSQLQRCADASAMAAAWQLADEGGFAGDPLLTGATSDAQQVASYYSTQNNVGSISPALDTSLGNTLSSDVVIGYMADFSDQHGQLDLTDPSRFNAVRVRVRRSSAMNGMVPSFFGHVMGISGYQVEGEAIAALASNISGFRIPYNGQNVEILPFALDEDTWNDLIAGYANDDWCWDAENQQIMPYGDGIKEVNLYPQGTGSPGNRGTVDIGSSNNSTNDISRQIVDGVSPADLEYHDGELKFDECGKLELNGDTGISAGVKDELASIMGDPRIIPIFREVNGPGNNAMYTIVKFAGVRIVDVKLTGKMSQKRVIIQPAPIVTKGAIRGETVGTSDLVFTPVTIIR